jgi:hypothetical protein
MAAASFHPQPAKPQRRGLRVRHATVADLIDQL